MSSDTLDVATTGRATRSGPVLTVTDLHIALRGGTELVRGVDFVLNRAGHSASLGSRGAESR